MISITTEEAKVLRATIQNLSQALTRVYQNKAGTRKHLSERGYPMPPDDEADDQVYDFMMHLDWFKDNPNKLDEVPPYVLIGVLQLLERGLPEDSTEDPEYDAHYQLLVRGVNILDLQEPKTLN